jgi:hypothetical protein
MEHGMPQQIQSMRTKEEGGQGLGVRAVYERVQPHKLKSRLTGLHRSLKLINKHFRTIPLDDISDESADTIGLLSYSLL